MIHIDLPEQIDSRLELLAMATGRSKKYYIREAIMQHLDEVEDSFYAMAGETAELATSPKQAGSGEQNSL